MTLSKFAGPALLALCFSTFILAQDTPPPMEATPDAQIPDAQTPESLLEIYLAKKAEHKAVNRQINGIYGQLSLANPEKKKRQLAEIQQLQDSLEPLMIEAFEAAVNALEEEKQDPRVVRDAVTYANACMGGPKYNIPIDSTRTVEICETLIEKGISSRSIKALAIRAATLSLDFETAKKHSQVSAEFDEKAIVLMREAVTEMESKWQRELELRENDKDLPRVIIKTSAGDITIDLFEDHAPETVANFISLIDNRFYNGLQFFEAKRGQYIRTGCVRNHGNSRPKYQIYNEATKESARHHFEGTISMLPINKELNCATQFVIAERPLPHFDGTFPVFGRVIQGMDLVHQLVLKTNAQERGAARATIESIEVLYRRPNSTYTPNKIPEN